MICVRWFVAAWCCLSAPVVWAASTNIAETTQGAAEPLSMEEVVVFGRNDNLIGGASSASEGSVGGADLLIRPLVKTAELLESMPGMVAVQHSGSGKANQYFLRGFILDHGTDYSLYLDGMPLNLRTHGHGQGYLDVNGLIPETVDRIDYRKGPYHAALGDFSLAGVSLVRTIDAIAQPFFSVAFGENGWQRHVGGASKALGSGTLSVIGEVKRYDGPWDQPEDLQHLALWTKYHSDTSVGQLSVSLSAYDAQWKPTEQIPERAIGTSSCPDAFCALDPTARGDTERWILNAQLVGADWNASLFGQYYNWSMTSNPTYDFQINQFDKRYSVGGRVEKTVLQTRQLDLEIGGELRHDEISKVGLDRFEAGQFLSNIGASQVDETSAAIYLDGVWRATERLRVMPGLRYDVYDFDANARSAGNFSGQQRDTQLSPKVSLAFAVNDGLELYASWGKGFHSNDARGVVNPQAPVPGLASGEGYEAGARLSMGDVKLTAAYWWLHQDSELVFIGDANTVEPLGSSKRQGAELSLFWRPRDWLALDAVLTQSRARFDNNPDGRWVPGAVEKSGQLGLTLTTGAWDASLRVRYLGPYALLADDSQRAGSLTTVNLRVARRWQSVTLFAEAINLGDSDGKEIVYYYPAYVAGLDPVGLSSDNVDCQLSDCRVSRATEPRALRAGVRYQF